MNVLLDEQIDAAVAQGLNAMSHRHGMSFQSIRAIAPGMKDPDIPNLCKSLGFAVLISANVRDFGAKKVLYEALLDTGTSVVVLRPGKKQILTPEVQLGVLSQHSSSVGSALSRVADPTLLRVTQGGVVERSLEELRREFEEGRELP